MSIEALKSRVATVLPEKRYAHTLGVYETAIKLAKREGVDEYLAGVAALLHDISKNESFEAMKKCLISHNLDAYLNYSPLVWHAPVGAIRACEQYEISHEDVLNAIKYHTTGREEMSSLEKIIFLADYIEPNRTQPGVNEIREIAKTSLDRAVAQTLSDTVAYLTSKDPDAIHPDTLRANAFYQTLS